jgi:histidyl-tRNA synthetase
MAEVTPVRGTRDYLPAEMRLRDRVQTIIQKSYQRNGFSRIQTPMLEHIDLLDKSEGGENLNLIFKILKRGQKLDLSKEMLEEQDLVDMGLRFDLTLPLSRYYANNRAQLRLPFKVIQIGQVFRAERPQRGRLREFYQCDIDIIGDASNQAEIELIHTTAKTLREIGFENFTVKINDRRILFELIESVGFLPEDTMSVCIVFDKLDKIGKDGVRAELLEKAYDEETVDRFIATIGDGKTGDLVAIGHMLPENEAVAGLSHIIDSVRELAQDNYHIEFDRSLARGMGYYTGTIFEVVSPDFNSAIAGGGRYDRMIGKLVGEDVPAVGFSIGFERICQILLDKEDCSMATEDRRLALIFDEADPFIAVIRKADELRESGYEVTTMRKQKKLGRQFAALQREGFAAALVYGDSEMRSLTEE